MRFIHTSDIHIGLTPDPDKFWANDRANDIKETFADIILKCKERDVDLLLISGNLFNHQPLTEELDFVNNYFKTIPNTKVFIVAGPSDHIKPNSIILNYKFSDNVTYFLNNLDYKFHINNSNVVIHGFSYFSPEESKPIVDSINPENDKSIHLLIFSGGDTTHIPFDINNIEKKNYTYVALGIRHNFEEVIEKKAYYSGSPEPIEQNDLGEHGIIYGEINESTRRITKLEFIKMAKSSYIPIKIKVNSKTTEDDLVGLVTREVIKLGNNNMFKIYISGMRNPDIEFSEDMFNKKIHIVSFTDSSNPKYDFIKLSSEHPQDMIGAFIRKMTMINSEPSEIEKKALYYGTHALLKSQEKGIIS